MKIAHLFHQINNEDLAIWRHLPHFIDYNTPLIIKHINVLLRKKKHAKYSCTMLSTVKSIPISETLSCEDMCILELMRYEILVWSFCMLWHRLSAFLHLTNEVWVSRQTFNEHVIGTVKGRGMQKCLGNPLCLLGIYRVKGDILRNK